MFRCHSDPSHKYNMGCGSSSGYTDEPKTIVVFGATGLLGGSIATALLEDPFHYRVRVVTRRPSSNKARKLAEAGAVIVTANLNDIQSLEKALDGADAMFLTTHYWEDKSKEKEIVRGLNAIDAAVHKGVQHIILNGSEYVKKQIGKDCGHLDSKASIEEYLREVGVMYTILRLPFWYENFLTVFKPHKIKHGVYAIALPIEGTTIDAISVADVGPCVMAIFQKPKNYANRVVGLTADQLCTEDMARLFTKHFENKKFTAPRIRVKDYEKFNFPGAKDLAAMFELYIKAPPTRDAKLTKKLNPHVRTLDKWLDQEHDTIEDVLIKEAKGGDIS